MLQRYNEKLLKANVFFKTLQFYITNTITFDYVFCLQYILTTGQSQDCLVVLTVDFRILLFVLH